jgi:hypothetical protein
MYIRAVTALGWWEVDLVTDVAIQQRNRCNRTSILVLNLQIATYADHDRDVDRVPRSRATHPSRLERASQARH